MFGGIGSEVRHAGISGGNRDHIQPAGGLFRVASFDRLIGHQTQIA
jgi:hypothetical protein